MPRITNRQHDAQIEAYLTGNAPFDEPRPLTRALAVRDVYGRDIARNSWKMTLERIQKNSQHIFVVDEQMCPVSLRRAKCIYLEGVDAAASLGKALYSWVEAPHRTLRFMLTNVSATHEDNAQTLGALARELGVTDFPAPEDAVGLRAASTLLFSSKEGFGALFRPKVRMFQSRNHNGDSLVWRDE